MRLKTNATLRDQANFVVGNVPAGWTVRVTGKTGSKGWWVYVDVPNAKRCGYVERPNSEGWRRQLNRDAFGEVLAAIRTPNLPDRHGALAVGFGAVQERAHRVGRAVHVFADEALTAAVVAEVQIELSAVEAAELGDLSGRAVQTVVLTRADVSPVQVAEADRIMTGDLLSTERQFMQLDPTAACVAAALWLHAAADVVADLSGIPSIRVVQASDDLEALAGEAPTAVLEGTEAGSSPTLAVTSLLRDAMAVAEGRAPDLDKLAAAIAEAEALADEHAADNPAARAEIRRLQLTPVDPRRPAPDLLEDLLAGINGCYLLYLEYSDADGDPSDDVDTNLDRERAAFCEDVRRRATAEHDRL